MTLLSRKVRKQAKALGVRYEFFGWPMELDGRIVGTTSFLEVSPEPCEPAAPPCLMVRDRACDEQGLQAGEPGEWRALPAGIEGYTPVAGEQHVVRVKRFEQAATDGGAPTVHFVLDMIIQTSTIR